MSDLSLFYCQGYVSTPIVEACEQRGLFKLLDIHEFRERTWLIKTLAANAGYFTIALEQLESLGWLEKKVDAYRLTSKAAGFRNRGLTPFYAIEPEKLIAQDTGKFKEKIEQVFLHPEARASAFSDPTQGSIIVPLVVCLQKLNPEKFCEKLNQFTSALASTLVELFSRQQWLTDDRAQLTASGKALLWNTAFDIAASYRLLLHSMDELLSGDSARAFRKKELPGVSHAFPSQKLSQQVFFQDLQQEIVEIFNHEPLREQPRSVIQMNCGDGTLLSWVSQTICRETIRGRDLAHMPIRLVAVDGSRRALQKAATTLAGLQHQTLTGDINKLDKLSRELEEAGITFEQELLHLHILVDHLITVDAKQPVNRALAVLAADQPAYYLDQKGRLIDAVTVLSCRQQHLRALAKHIHNSPLLVLESHAASSGFGRECTDSESFQFDCIHRMAREYSISAEAFITLAASAGLFNAGCVKRYPRTSDPCEITLHRLSKRNYIVRHATKEDMERLWQLEQLCWQHTQTPKDKICSRLERYPQGQFVLEKEGKILGVIYSQRIARMDELASCNAANIDKLHQERGVIIQLLAVNIDPQAQDSNYGDQLLEFMLQRCSLVTGVEAVVGVTLCKKYDFASDRPFEQYIQQQGSEQDPVLAFHQSHGAEIVKAIPGYRPEDHANLSNGVLVSYDIHNRTPRRQRPRGEKTLPVPNKEAVKADQQTITQFVEERAAQLLGIGRSQLDIDRPVMEMGLDSADLLKLQGQLEERFCLELQAGFFFEHSTIRKISALLMEKLAANPEISPRSRRYK